MGKEDKSNDLCFIDKVIQALIAKRVGAPEPQFTRKELRKIYWMAFKAEFFRVPFVKTKLEKAIAKREKMEGR